MPDELCDTADQPLLVLGHEPYLYGQTAAPLQMTDHSEQRHHQRAIPEWAIELALRGRPTWSHGRLVYRVTDRLLLQLGHEDMADRLRGLTVVTAVDGTIVTVKWDGRLRQRGCLRRSRLGRHGTTPLIHRFRRRPPTLWRRQGLPT